MACSCEKLDTFQKNKPIPDKAWTYQYHPSFEVNITDTAALYNIYVTLRHTNAYPFSNLWLMISLQGPRDSVKTNRVELPLADASGKWLGSGMDDIYDHRIPIQQNARFDTTGTYRFTFEQNMRINPLPDVLSVGLSVEKEKAGRLP